MKNTALLLLFVLYVLTGCNNRQPVPAKEIKLTEYFNYSKEDNENAGVKMIPITTAVGTFKVWTKKIGNNPQIKVLLLHGGPGLTHEYMECFETFLPKEGFEIIQYDQLGSYYSDQPTDSSLWTLERFTEELEQVRTALGLDSSNFYLLGNSWGGILAIEYALKYQQNLKGLIISNMTAGFKKYGEYNAKLRSQMSKSLVDSLETFETKGDFLNPMYQKLVFDEYYCRHILRKPASQWPEPVLRSFKHINQSVYEILQGPSEFVPGGRLLSWERWGSLKNITIPALMIGAHYDTMNPEEMEEMSKLVQHGKYLYCPTGSHLSMWDAQQEYYPGIIDFIKAVNEKKF